MKVIISGGGSGGHIFPAIAIANELKRRNANTEILFVGAEGKMEMERIPKAGYKIEGLWISGFQRKLTLKNLSFPFKLISSLIKARKILKRFKPDVVIGVGGYASGPTLEMATRLGIPTLIQEQNSYPGITNRLLAKKVNKICVAYDGLERFFPKDKIIKTGNPIRGDFKDLKKLKNEAYPALGFDSNKKTIVVTGGSLGARTLNEMMRDNHDVLKKNQDIQVLWQAGKLYIEQFSKTETAQLANVKITAFIERMDYAFAAADIVVCRAGASTISELYLAGQPSILIPSPNVSEDHQTANAKALSEREAAILVTDKEAVKAIPEAIELLKNEEKLQQIGANCLAMAKPNSTAEIVDEIYGLMG